MQSTNNLVSSPSSGKTSLLGKFLVTYVERLCLRFGKMQLDAMWTRSNTKMKTKDAKTHKNRGPDFPGSRPDYPGVAARKLDDRKNRENLKT